MAQLGLNGVEVTRVHTMSRRARKNLPDAVQTTGTRARPKATGVAPATSSAVARFGHGAETSWGRKKKREERGETQ